jgi:hypothetical protein
MPRMVLLAGMAIRGLPGRTGGPGSRHTRHCTTFPGGARPRGGALHSMCRPNARMARLGALEPPWSQIGDPARQQVAVLRAKSRDSHQRLGGSAVRHQPGGTTRRFRPGCIH